MRHPSKFRIFPALVCATDEMGNQDRPRIEWCDCAQPNHRPLHLMAEGKAKSKMLARI